MRESLVRGVSQEGGYCILYIMMYLKKIRVSLFQVITG